MNEAIDPYVDHALRLYAEVVKQGPSCIAATIPPKFHCQEPTRAWSERILELCLGGQVEACVNTLLNPPKIDPDGSHGM